MEGSKTKSKPDCRRAGHFYAFAFFFSLQLLRKLLPLEAKRRWAEKKRAKGEVYMDVSRFSLFFYVYTGLLVDGEELSFVFTFGAFPRVWLIIYCKNQNKVGFFFNEWTSS
jgi:hypothetical protein